MQPEPLAQNETPQPEPITPEEVTHPETPPVQEEKPPKKANVTAIVLGVLVFILFVGAAGLGYMAYTLNTKLTSTQQELTTLQASHDQLQAEHSSLQSDYAKLSADLEQTKSDLEKANADLKTTQDDLTKTQDNLKKSQGQVSDLNTKLDNASVLAEIVYAWSNVGNQNDIIKIDSLVEKANDKQLSSLWDTLISSPSTQGFDDFFSYLVKALRDNLK